MKVLPLALALAALLAFTGSALAQSSGSSSSGKTADCTAQNGPLPEAWSGKAFAIDGDTMAAVGLKPHIRLWGIQAPELRDKQTGQETAAGMRSRADLVAMLSAGKQNVACRVTKWDRYCRLVAQCFLDGTSLDIGSTLIGRGMAYGYYLEEALPWDADTGARYAEREVRAQEARTGLWRHWLGEK